ncbi:MAG: cyclase family protein [Bacteroidales bacterium]|nr:cyclase family protein [Bacteroidales bacterium]
MARAIDLTHTVRSGMTVYPGTLPPAIDEVCTIAADGFSERRLHMFSHTGTHIDMPAHIFPDGKTITGCGPEQFFGKALVVELNAFGTNTINFIKKRLAGKPLPSFIIFKTGWDRYWGLPAYFHNFPVPADDVTDFICTLGLKGIGIDTISVDPTGSINLTNHRKLLPNNIIIVENLCNLDKLPETAFDFFCFPLKIENGDGSPVRAVAIVNQPEDDA